MDNVPVGITRDQWTSFLNYRYKEETQIIIAKRSNNVGCSSSGCQEKYNQLMNTLKAYIIMKEGSIPEQFAGIFASPPTTPSDAASGPVSQTDARRSSGASNPSNNY
nr:uncharacterized protein LOC117280537 [Nicotiana tomentosiformis]